MKRRHLGWPPRVADRHAPFNAAAIERAIRACPAAAPDLSAEFAGDYFSLAAEAELETKAADLVAAARSAPTDD